MVRQCAFAAIAALALSLAATPSPAAEIDASAPFFNLSADRVAANVGDNLTVLVLETSAASRSTSSRGARSARVTALGYQGSGRQVQPEASFGGAFSGAGASSRSDNLVAQISVNVDSLAPNGDLLVSGEQLLRIDGERTKITLQGKVRRADISANNTVLSSQLSGVTINYQGSGYSTRSGSPGFVVRVLSWLGLVL
jgi:flagellar L-ring protein precursor FlgH